MRLKRPIKRGTPGLKTNRVMATADNATLVNDRADTRFVERRQAPVTREAASRNSPARADDDANCLIG